MLADQPEQHLPTFSHLQVEPDRALAAVQREEQRRGRARLHARVLRRRPADVVAEPGVLDLEHVGAVVGEQQRADSRRAAAARGRAPGCRAQRARSCEHRSAPRRPSRRGGRRPRPSARARADEVAVGARHRAVRAGRSCPPARRAPSRRAPAPRRRASTAAREIPISPQWLPAGMLSTIAARLRAVGGTPPSTPITQETCSGGVQHALVDERLERADVPEVEALVLGLDPELVHRLEQRDDLVERVGEDHREHEVAPAARVLRVVHRAHVQRRDVGPERAQVGDPLLDRHADRARGEVDDDVDLGA